MGVELVGTGMYVPPEIETTQQVADRLKISAEEILRITGIEQRHLAGDETASSMGQRALADAIESSGIDRETIDGVIVATFTGDYLYPSTALKLVQSLELQADLAYDLMANCAGMQTAIENARALLIANPAMRVIAVVGVAKQSPFVDPNDTNSAYFFGDAASAMLLRRNDSGADPGANPGADSGFRPTYFSSSTRNYELVRLRGGGSSYPAGTAEQVEDPRSRYYEHAGLGVWKEVVVQLPKIIRRALDDLGWSRDDLDLILFHQANLRLIEYCMARLRVPMSKSINNVATIGNTAEASIGTVVHEAFRAGRFGNGQKILLASVGAGFLYAVTPYHVH